MQLWYFLLHLAQNERISLGEVDFNQDVECHVQCNAGLPQNINSDNAYLDTVDSNKVKWQIADRLNINRTFVFYAIDNGTTARFWGTLQVCRMAPMFVF